MALDFDQVIQHNDKRLRFIAQRYGGHEYKDDVYQEILLQLWRSFTQFRGEANMSTWIYRIALNAALMWLRKQRKPHVSSEQAPEPSEPHGQCQAGVLEDFFASLNEVDSMTLMMHLDNLSANEIADVLGIKTNAVQVRINRLKQKFNDRYVD